MIKKICVPTLPKIFRPVTQNTLIFYLALFVVHSIRAISGFVICYFSTVLSYLLVKIRYLWGLSFDVVHFSYFWGFGNQLAGKERETESVREREREIQRDRERADCFTLIVLFVLCVFLCLSVY